MCDVVLDATVIICASSSNHQNSIEDSLAVLESMLDNGCRLVLDTEGFILTKLSELEYHPVGGKWYETMDLSGQVTRVQRLKVNRKDRRVQALGKFKWTHEDFKHYTATAASDKLQRKIIVSWDRNFKDAKKNLAREFSIFVVTPTEFLKHCRCNKHSDAV